MSSSHEHESRTNKIDFVIEALRECWHENPHLRLGQLIVNIIESDNIHVIYNTNDSLWLKKINYYRKMNDLGD